MPRKTKFAAKAVGDFATCPLWRFGHEWVEAGVIFGPAALPDEEQVALRLEMIDDEPTLAIIYYPQDAQFPPRMVWRGTVGQLLDDLYFIFVKKLTRLKRSE